MINKDLENYILNNILKEYDKNDKGHGIDHINYVINRSLRFGKQQNLNLDMLYTIAAYHDIGHHIDRKNHEKVSADIMSKDKNLESFFNVEELKIIKEAIEDHRASSNEEPRSLYGKVVSTADRSTDVDGVLMRTYVYRKKHTPNATDEEIATESYLLIEEKFGTNGYAKTYIKDEEYEEFLNKVQVLLKDKENFKLKQQEAVNKYNNLLTEGFQNNKNRIKSKNKKLIISR